MQKLFHCFVITLLGIQGNQVFKSESPTSLIPNHTEHQFKSINSHPKPNTKYGLDPDGTGFFFVSQMLQLESILLLPIY